MIVVLKFWIILFFSLCFVEKFEGLVVYVLGFGILVFLWCCIL